MELEQAYTDVCVRVFCQRLPYRAEAADHRPNVMLFALTHLEQKQRYMSGWLKHSYGILLEL